MTRSHRTVFVILFAVVTARGADAEPVTRVVRPGDCLGVLAEEYGVTVAQLRRWNDLEDDTIRVGQPLVVARGSTNGAARSGRAASRRRTYRVVAGDTLSEIAQRHGIDQGALIRANPRVDPDHLVVGERLTLPAGASANRRRGSAAAPLRLAFHRVRRGETLSDIARRYGVTVDDIMAWNRGLRPRRLAVEQRLRLRTRRPLPSRSIGTPWGGTLEHGRRLEPHPGYAIRSRAKAWGTEETVRLLRRAFDRVVKQHPRAPRVRIHDISRRGGGALAGHRSHQSGRDVDMTYYQRRCPRSGCPLTNVTPARLDPRPQWTLFRTLIRSGRVQLIFVDYELQRVLYEHARRRGATREQLRRWFQYPRARNVPVGIIRHYTNHRNHAHIRFACPRGDQECR